MLVFVVLSTSRATGQEVTTQQTGSEQTPKVLFSERNSLSCGRVPAERAVGGRLSVARVPIRSPVHTVSVRIRLAKAKARELERLFWSWVWRGLCVRVYEGCWDRVVVGIGV